MENYQKLMTMIKNKGVKCNEETKAADDNVDNVAAGLAVAGAALLGWGVWSLLSGDNSRKSRMMKAPGRPDIRIFRDTFESDPASYFRNLRKD